MNAAQIIEAFRGLGDAERAEVLGSIAALMPGNPWLENAAIRDASGKVVGFRFDTQSPLTWNSTNFSPEEIQRILNADREGDIDLDAFEREVMARREAHRQP